MGKLKLASENLISALDKLEETIENFEQAKKSEKEKILEFMDKEELIESLRDSLIQRFEFCVDLFWKYLKKYLEEILNIIPEASAPRPVIQAACKTKIISEVDAEVLLEMIKSRNMTSHIYKEEIADRISIKIPAYYKIMKKYAEKLI